MARARNLKPGFFRNAKLLECSPWARLLFAGLWGLADRRGVLEDRPKQIKVDLLPADDPNVDALLGELQAQGLILRYEVNGRRCIWVIGFLEHQKPHKDEPESGLPSPPEKSPGETRCSPEKTGPIRPLTSSLLPLPSSLLPLSSPLGECSTDEAIYQAYPRHVGKASALKAIRNARSAVAARGIDPGTFLLDRVLAYANVRAVIVRADASENQFTPYPATWFNKGRYDDDPEEWVKPTKRSSNATRSSQPAAERGEFAEDLTITILDGPVVGGGRADSATGGHEIPREIGNGKAASDAAHQTGG